MSAQTARLASTPAPAGKPGGPGLYRVRGLSLPPYFQNVRNALIRSGHPPAEAYQITWGAIRRWAHGGGKAHPEVVAAARAALAALAADSARAHSHANTALEAITLARVAPAGGTAAVPAPAVKGPTGAQVNAATGATGPRAKPPSSGKGKQPAGGGGSGFDAKHPRVGAGNTGGGRFAKKGTGTTSAASGSAAAKPPAKAKAKAKPAAKPKTAAKPPAAKTTAPAKKTAAKKPPAVKTPAKKTPVGKAAPPKMTGAPKPAPKPKATPKPKAAPKPKAKAKPKPNLNTRAGRLEAKTQLRTQAKNDRAKARAIFTQIKQLTAAIHTQVKANAASKASTTATKTAAAAATAATAATAAAAKTAATAATTTAKTTAATTAKTTSSVPAMRATRAGLRTQAHTLVTRAAKLDKQATAIHLTNAGSAAALELVGPKGYEHGWIKVGPAQIRDSGRKDYLDNPIHEVHLNGQHVADVTQEEFYKDSGNPRSRVASGRKVVQGYNWQLVSPEAKSAVAHMPYGPRSRQLQGGKALTSKKAAVLDALTRHRDLTGGMANDTKAIHLTVAGPAAALELAGAPFREELARRVPPGKPGGGQFTQPGDELTRHATPDQTAVAVNRLAPDQRAVCRATVLPPPGYEWAAADRLIPAT